MKIVISPAKSLNFEKELPTTQYTEPAFLKEARQVHKVLKPKKPAELSELMSISEKLSDLNWERNQKWKTPFSPENRFRCLYHSVR
jgi:uncharacterized protein